MPAFALPAVPPNEWLPVARLVCQRTYCGTEHIMASFPSLCILHCRVCRENYHAIGLFDNKARIWVCQENSPIVPAGRRRCRGINFDINCDNSIFPSFNCYYLQCPTENFVAYSKQNISLLFSFQANAYWAFMRFQGCWDVQKKPFTY